MFESMKFAALLQKFNKNDPKALPAVDVFKMANNDAKSYDDKEVENSVTTLTSETNKRFYAGYVYTF